MEKPHITTEQQDCPTLSLAQRRAFMQLPLEERRRLLAKQAEEMLEHYQKSTQWRELQTGDIVEY